MLLVLPSVDYTYRLQQGCAVKPSDVLLPQDYVWQMFWAPPANAPLTNFGKLCSYQQEKAHQNGTHFNTRLS